MTLKVIVDHSAERGTIRVHPADFDKMQRAMVIIESAKSIDYVGPARQGIEAQDGLNDTYTGDPYP